LRTARSHTGGICIVETQVAPNLSGVMDWGSHRYPMQMVGSFALVDESVEVARDNREANTVAVSLCPSLEALLFTMSAVGFKSVEVLKAPDGMNDQLTIGKRVMVVGQADS
jgi:hypothetical protein